MAKRSKCMRDAAFKAKVARTFLDSSRLRKWVRPEPAEGDTHVFHVIHDGPPKNVIAKRHFPGKDVPQLDTNKKNVCVDIIPFQLPDIQGGWSACQAAEAIGRSAGEWLDGHVVGALVNGLPYETTSIDITETGISKNAFIRARGSFLEDGHPQMDALCAVLPAKWYVTMLSKDMPIYDWIYHEGLAGGIEVIFRPNEELCNPDDDCQRGFIFTRDTLRWAESGWLSDIAGSSLGKYSEIDLNEHPEQPGEEVLSHILKGGAAVVKKKTGIIEIIRRTASAVSTVEGRDASRAQLPPQRVMSASGS